MPFSKSSRVVSDGTEYEKSRMLVCFADFFEQSKILHVTCANLQDICVLRHNHHIAVTHHFRDDPQPRFRLGFLQQSLSERIVLFIQTEHLVREHECDFRLSRPQQLAFVISV